MCCLLKIYTRKPLFFVQKIEICRVPSDERFPFLIGPDNRKFFLPINDATASYQKSFYVYDGYVFDAIVSINIL